MRSILRSLLWLRLDLETWRRQLSSKDKRKRIGSCQVSFFIQQSLWDDLLRYKRVLDGCRIGFLQNCLSFMGKLSEQFNEVDVDRCWWDWAGWVDWFKSQLTLLSEKTRTRTESNQAQKIDNSSIKLPRLRQTTVRRGHFCGEKLSYLEEIPTFGGEINKSRAIYRPSDTAKWLRFDFGRKYLILDRQSSVSKSHKNWVAQYALHLTGNTLYTVNARAVKMTLDAYVVENA